MKIDKKVAEAFNYFNYIMKKLDFYSEFFSENERQYVSCFNQEKHRKFYDGRKSYGRLYFVNINECKSCKYFEDVKWKRDNWKGDDYYSETKKLRCGLGEFGELSLKSEGRIVYQATEDGLMPVMREVERKLPKTPEHVKRQLAEKRKACHPIIVIKKPLGSVIDGVGPEDWDGVKEKTHWKKLKQLNENIIFDEEKEYD